MSVTLTMTALVIVFLIASEIWDRFRPSLYEQILRGQIPLRLPIVVKRTGVFEWSLVDPDGRVVLTRGTPDCAHRIARQLNAISLVS